MSKHEDIRKVYNEIAAKYHIKRADPDQGAWNKFLEEPAMVKFLQPLVKGRTVLDLGCGTGILTKKIADWGGNVEGVDIAEKMIAIARRELPDIKFEIADAADLPYADREFDIVASSLVMHYTRDLLSVFSEIGRVLKNQGEYVFSIHHPFQESFKLDKKRDDGRPVMQPYFNDDKYYWSMCGVQLESFHHTFENIINALCQTGFTVIDLVECRPDENMKDIFKDYEFTSQYPTFCVFRTGKR